MKINAKIKDLDKFLESIEFENSLSACDDTFNFVAALETNREIELSNLKQTRSSQQNRALHKLFSIIANMLNDLGITFNYDGITGKEFEIKYSTEVVKDFIWRPLQITLTGKKSTTQLTTEDMDVVFKVICKFFNDRGHELHFPSSDWQRFEQWYNENIYETKR